MHTRTLPAFSSLTPDPCPLFSPHLRPCGILFSMDFQLVTSYKPKGDQPRAIDELLRGLAAGERVVVEGPGDLTDGTIVKENKP